MYRGASLLASTPPPKPKTLPKAPPPKKPKLEERKPKLDGIKQNPKETRGDTYVFNEWTSTESELKKLTQDIKVVIDNPIQKFLIQRHNPKLTNIGSLGLDVHSVPEKVFKPECITYVTYYHKLIERDVIKIINCFCQVCSNPNVHIPFPAKLIILNCDNDKIIPQKYKDSKGRELNIFCCPDESRLDEADVFIHLPSKELHYMEFYEAIYTYGCVPITFAKVYDKGLNINDQNSFTIPITEFRKTSKEGVALARHYQAKSLMSIFKTIFDNQQKINSFLNEKLSNF